MGVPMFLIIMSDCLPVYKGRRRSNDPVESESDMFENRDESINLMVIYLKGVYWKIND